VDNKKVSLQESNVRWPSIFKVATIDDKKDSVEKLMKKAL